MTRSSAAAALVVTVLLAVLLWERDVRPPPERSTGALHPPRVDPATGELLTAPVRARPVPPAEERSTTPPRETEPRPMPDEVQQRRQRVLAELARRAPSARTEPASASAEAHGLKDRTGDSSDTVKALNEQLMPLIDSCLDQARERGVPQRGMLALHVQLASANGVGQIIEAVEPVSSSAVDDAELIDCVRQSAFSIDLPPPNTDGRSGILLTIPFEAAPDGGAAPRRR